MIDITPKVNQESQILFLPDNAKVYEGVQVDNYRFPLKKDRLITDFIQLSRMIFQVQKEGELAKVHRLIGMDSNKILPLLQCKLVIQEMLQNGLTEDDPCFCGLDRKYKNCHGGANSSMPSRISSILNLQIMNYS